MKRPPELVQVARLGGEHHEGPAERAGDRAAQLDPLRGLGHGGQRHGGRAVVELGGPDRLEAGLLRPARCLRLLRGPAQLVTRETRCIRLADPVAGAHGRSGLSSTALLLVEGAEHPDLRVEARDPARRKVDHADKQRPSSSSRS